MSTLLPRDDPRTLKAIDIARTAHAWRRLTTPDGEVLLAIPSASVRGLFYLTSEITCTCLDYVHNGLREGRGGSTGLHLLCKHIRAVHLERIQREAADNGLVLERLPNGSYEWLRRP